MLNEIGLFQFPGPPESSLETFERLMQSNRQVCNAQLSITNHIRLVFVDLGDDRVRGHLQLNASRIATWKAHRVLRCWSHVKTLGGDPKNHRGRRP